MLKYRKGGPKPASTKKADIMDAYTKAPKRKPTKVWSRSEEAELKKCREEEVEVSETALSVSAVQIELLVTIWPLSTALPGPCSRQPLTTLRIQRSMMLSSELT